MAEGYAELLAFLENKRWVPAIDQAALAIRALIEERDGLLKHEPDTLETPLKCGCHCDLFDLKNPEPDDCVLNTGRREDCIYARGISVPSQCEYWQVITPESIRAALGETK